MPPSTRCQCFCGMSHCCTASKPGHAHTGMLLWVCVGCIPGPSGFARYLLCKRPGQWHLAHVNCVDATVVARQQVVCRAACCWLGCC
jgi:hypothetical protein